LVFVTFRAEIFGYIIGLYGGELRASIKGEVESNIASLKDHLRTLEHIRDDIRIQTLEHLREILSAQREVAGVRADVDAQHRALKELLNNVDAEKEKIIEKITQAQSTAELAFEHLKNDTSQIQVLIDNQNSILESLKAQGLSPKINPVPLQENANGHRGTVYFQFTGLGHDLAKRISSKLHESGWTIPVEEPAAAVNTNEVRYHTGDKDKARAERLAKDAIAALDTLNLPITKLEPRESAHVKPGILELWVHHR